MGIGAVSASWTETFATLGDWRRERLPHGLFVPAALTLALAASLGEGLSPGVLLRVPVAWAALALLRLWDDLEDREVDRRAHPERAGLGEAPGRIVLLVVAGLLGVALWLPAFLGLAAALLVFYRSRRAPLEAVLLLKYPVLVGVLRGSVDAPGLGAMALVYGGMLLDSELRLPGGAVVWISTLGLAWLAGAPGAWVVLAVGLALPWVKPVRPGALAGIVVQLLAFQLGTR
jgi:hypothetical protein